MTIFLTWNSKVIQVFHKIQSNDQGQILLEDWHTWVASVYRDSGERGVEWVRNAMQVNGPRTHDPNLNPNPTLNPTLALTVGLNSLSL